MSLNLDKQMKCQYKAYTLVEILIVMSIMGVLISMLLGGARIAREKAKRARVQALFDSIGAGLQMYQDSFLTYPPDDQFYRSGATIVSLSSSESLYVHLAATYKTGVNASKFAGPMMVFQPEQLQEKRTLMFDIDADAALESTMEIIDPWGHPLQYRFPPSSARQYDLWSYGSNGINDNGSGDDINNWQ